MAKRRRVQPIQVLLLQGGHSIRSFAADLGVPYTTVYERIIGRRPRPQGAQLQEWLDAISGYLEREVSADELFDETKRASTAGTAEAHATTGGTISHGNGHEATTN